MIVNANNRLVPDAYPYAITDDWAAPWRARRIIDLLSEQDIHDADSFAAIQTDTTDISARATLPMLLAGTPLTQAGRAAQARMTDWDGDMGADSAEGLIHAAWMKAMARAVYGDDLGDAFDAMAATRSVFMASVLSGENAHWCDDITTPQVESCADLSGPALDDAVAMLRDEYGPNMQNWRWGDAHPAYFPHAPFALFPVLDDIFSARIAVGGTADTVNEAGFTYRQDGFVSSHGPSLRAIHDLADPAGSLFAMPMGQSGHLASPHYRDLLAPWAAGDYFPLRADGVFDPDATLTLTPEAK